MWGGAPPLQPPDCRLVSKFHVVVSLDPRVEGAIAAQHRPPWRYWTACFRAIGPHRRAMTSTMKVDHAGRGKAVCG